VPSLKHLSIKTQLTIMTVSTVAILLLIVVFTTVQVTGLVVRNNREYVDEVMKQIDQSVASNGEFLDNLMLSLQYDSLVQEYLSTDDALKRYEIFGKLDTNLLGVLNLKSGILDVVLLGANGSAYYYKGRQPAVVERILEMGDVKGHAVSGLLELTYDGAPHECFLLVSDVVSNLKDGSAGRRLGTAAIVIERAAFGTDAVDALAASASTFYLVDRNGVVFSGNDATRLFRPLPAAVLAVAPGEVRSVRLDGQSVSVRAAALPRIGGRIVNVTRTTQLVGDLVGIRNLMIALSAIGGLLLLGLFLVIARNILRPLDRFMGHLARVGVGAGAGAAGGPGGIGGLQERAELDGYKEINEMAARFNAMLEEIDGLARSLLATNSRMYEMQLQKKQAEIAQLKSQINPHFLYNSLESMKGVALSEHADKVFQMLTALGRMFYYSFKGADIVRMREEMTTIQSYVRIQQVRFEDRFDVETDVPDALMDCLIPKMCLQPLVENAVFHGLETREGKGRLRIEGRIEEAPGADPSGAGRVPTLTLRIVDDGVGIEPDRLAALQAQLAAETPPNGIMKPNPGTVGLMNVHSRVRLMYGAGYGLWVESEPGRGSVVTLRLPVRRDDA
jgi:two-component system, sensor histidine kinase YesM